MGTSAADQPVSFTGGRNIAMAGISQAELWLQLTTEDTSAAAQHLAASPGVARCDEIEPLPAEASAFWISSTASIVHLVSQPDTD